jgi:hypothetical protein
MAITVKHTKVSTVPDTADTSLVRPSDWNADHTLTGLGTAAELDAGVANGVATLDAGGTVPISQIPASIIGGLIYQGTWNASTNTPTLASGVGTKGYYYAVSVAGTTNLDGITDWNVGDLAVYNGTAWQQIDNTDAVTSVNGYTGTVVLGVNDISGAANAPTNTNITSMTGVTGGISSPDYVQFDTTYATTLTAGQLGWNGNDTLGLGMIGGNVIQHIGEDQFFYIKATSSITKGQVVMFTGAVGASGVSTGAPATGITDGTYIMGVAAESIALNGFGLIQTFGTLRNVNTTGYADGDILWYDPAVTGGLTKTKPVAPNVKVQMAAVINGGSSGGGTILIRIDAGSTLGGSDSNAQITSPSNGQFITYDGQDGYWKNTDLGAGTGISISESATGVVTVTNSAPDQTVSISAGTGISTSGTYPNFTVTNTAPDQVVSISGGGTTTVTGTYPNFTVSSDDQYDGTVTSVDLTAGTGISVSGGPITSSGSITVTNTAPDQVVAISAGTGISTSGTYPNFTVTNTAPDQTVAISAGTGISVSGTYPNFTVTNTAPDVPFTYTSTYVPYGQGTTTPDQSADFTYDESVKTVTAPQVRASNGIVVNSATVSANYSIPSGSNAMSAGPITVASGITVTIPSGNAWVIV